MSTRQYIGARYVPKFMGVWDATTEYEAITVVENGLGTSYISKKPVPVGTPLTNTNYWMVYGSTNGAILHLQERVDNLEAGKDLIIIAASYGITPSVGDNCINYLKTLLSNTYDNIFDSSLGGAGFVNGQFLSQLQALTIDNPEYVKDILVIGIGNDIYQSDSDVTTAITNFVDYAKATYPNATVSIAPVSSQGTDTGATALYNCFKNIIDNSPIHGAAVMSKIYHILGIDYASLLAADQGHPTSAGAKVIANGIYNLLVNGDFNIFSLRNEDTIANKSYEKCKSITLYNENT